MLTRRPNTIVDSNGVGSEVGELAVVVARAVELNWLDHLAFRGYFESRRGHVKTQSGSQGRSDKQRGCSGGPSGSQSAGKDLILQATAPTPV